MTNITTKRGSASPPSGGVPLVAHRPEPLKESADLKIDPVVEVAHEIWDVVAMRTSVTRNELRSLIVIPSESWREYLRWRNEKIRQPKPRSNELQQAEREYIDRAVECAVEHGWLAIKRAENPEQDVLTLGNNIPPEYSPLSSLRGEHLAWKTLTKEEDRKALTFLRRKDSRVKPDARKRKALRESLSSEGIGRQLYPILRWNYLNEIFILDGANREELMIELGLEPWYQDQDPALTPSQALQIRVTAELHHTTKQEEKIHEFIKEMAEAGFTDKSIAVLVNLSRQRVQQIKQSLGLTTDRAGWLVSRIDQGAVDRMKLLHDQGWSNREIGRHLGCDDHTVAKYLAVRNGASATSTSPQSGESDSDPLPELPQEDTKLYWIIQAIFGTGPVTQTDVEDALGIRRSGQSFTSLVSRNIIQVVGVRYQGDRDGKVNAYALTNEGRQACEAMGMEPTEIECQSRDQPKPKSQPTAKKPRPKPQQKPKSHSHPCPCCGKTHRCPDCQYA